MARARRWGARWIALLLGGALVASAVVAYALIRVTAPGAGTDQAVSSTQATVTPHSPSARTDPVSPADARVSSAATDPATSAGAASAPATPTSPPTGAPSASLVSSGVPAGSSAAASSQESPTTVTSVLAGSGITLPAAWSGRATMTVTVLGSCATKNPSVYTDAPADLALDLPQNEAIAVAPTATTALPGDEPTLTLGVNASQVPSLAVYSASVDESGALHRYWQLQLTPGLYRTEIHGTLVDETVDAANPNILVDAETSLQPCETAGTVAPPRVLAAGATITGWVSQTSARLTLQATTTDGKREVTVVVTATRKQ